MCCVVAYNGSPFAIKQTFKLDDELDHFVTFQLKLNAHGILVIKEAAKFNGTHEIVKNLA